MADRGLRRAPRERRHADRRPDAARRRTRAAAADPRFGRELHAAARCRLRADRRALSRAPARAAAGGVRSRRARSAVLFETFPFGRRALRFELCCRCSTHRARRAASARASRRSATSCNCSRSPSASARWSSGPKQLVRCDPRARRPHASRASRTRSRSVTSSRRRCATRGSSASASRAPTRRRMSARATRWSYPRAAAASASSCSRRRSPRNRIRARDLTWRVLAGPNISEDGARAPAPAAGPRAIVERARVDFAALLRRACVSISQAGLQHDARRDRRAARAR